MTICMHTPIERQRHVPCALCQVEELQQEVRRLQQLIRVADDVGNKAATEIAQLRGELTLAEEGLANYAQEVERYRVWHAGGRWNVEATDDGVRLCRGEHEKQEPCRWEYFRSSPPQEAKHE